MGFESGQFDLQQLWERTDEARTERGLTWSRISQEVGVAASTIRRFATAADAEADGVLTLIGWLGAAPEEFVVESKVAGVLLPPAGEGMIRVDMLRLVGLPTWPQRARTGTRTTIQRLASAAQASETTIASLTRWSAL